MTNSKLKLHKKIILEYQLKVLTGLHIGAGSEAVEIGGIDLPIIRRKDNHAPYIPGSSLKGKLRSLLQLDRGEFSFEGKSEDSPILRLFGNGHKEFGHSSRLIVRDAYLTKESDELLFNSPSNDMPYSEVKAENVISRTRGSSDNLRFIERIPAGAEFSVQFVINILDIPNGEKSPEEIENDYLKTLEKGINLLNNDYLGGHGSRGYGQVLLTIQKEEKITL